MFAVFVHQLHDHLLSLRFPVSLLAVVGLFAANGFLYTWKYQRLFDLTPYVEADVARPYGEIRDLNELASHSFRLMNRRLPTEFMADGGASWFGDAFWVQAQTGGDFRYGSVSRSSNHWMRRYEMLDWVWIVRLVVSFLCIVLAYDGVSREWESGTLRQVLANPLSRGRWLMGTFWAHWVVVMAVCGVGSLVSLLILGWHGILGLDGRIVADWGLFLGGTGMFAALFLLLTLGVSAGVRSSAGSLVVLVLVWAGVMVVIPQTSYLAAVRAVELDRDWKGRLPAYVGEVEEGLRQEGIALRPRGAAAADGFALEQRYRQRLAVAEQEGVRRLQAAYGTAVRQYRVAQGVHLVSPGFAFQYAVEALLGTGLPKYQHFERQAWAYREALRDFIRTRDAADPESPHLLFLPGYLSEKPLEGRQVPRFQEERLPLGESVSAGWVPLLVLVLEAGGAFFLALGMVNRMELTG